MTCVTKWDLGLIDMSPPLWESELRGSYSYLVVNLGSDCQSRDLCSGLCLNKKGASNCECTSPQGRKPSHPGENR